MITVRSIKALETLPAFSEVKLEVFYRTLVPMDFDIIRDFVQTNTVVGLKLVEGDYASYLDKIFSSVDVSKLKELVLPGNELNGSRLQPLFDMLAGAGAIETLELSNNKLQDTDVEKLCEALQQNQNIHTLVLLNNQLSPKILSKLIELSKATNVRHFDLRFNQIPHSMIEEFNKAVKQTEAASPNL